MMHEFSLHEPPQLYVYNASEAVNQQKSSHSNQQCMLENTLDVLDSFRKDLSWPVVDIQR